MDIPDTITLTHLLRHTSGLHDYGPLPEYHDAVRTHPGLPWTRQQFLDAVIPKGLAFGVTRQSFARIIDRFIAAPLKLHQTGRSYHHAGGGPGYDLAATVYPDTSLGRVAIVVFADTSCGPRAETLKERLIQQLLDQP